MGGEVINNPEHREEVRKMMESVIVIQASHITSIDQICYTALCEQFRALDVGETIPNYIPTFINSIDGKITVKWEEWKQYTKFNEKVQ